MPLSGQLQAWFHPLEYLVTEFHNREDDDADGDDDDGDEQSEEDEEDEHDMEDKDDEHSEEDEEDKGIFQKEAEIQRRKRKLSESQDDSFQYVICFFNVTVSK